MAFQPTRSHLCVNVGQVRGDEAEAVPLAATVELAKAGSVPFALIEGWFIPLPPDARVRQQLGMHALIDTGWCWS
jgi:hypothetical protein